MAVLRAHQIHTPMILYENAHPGAVTKGIKQGTHNIQILDSDYVEGCTQWNTFLDKAKNGTLHPTEFVQVVNILARTRRYSLQEILRITLNSLYASFGNLEYKIREGIQVNAVKLILASSYLISSTLKLTYNAVFGNADNYYAWEIPGKFIDRI